MIQCPIGYYVHHHGTGHMRRALNIVKHMTVPVVLFSSREPGEALPPHVSFIKLPSDAVADYTQPRGSVLHYTPYDAQIFARNQILIDNWRDQGIRQMHVDVSVEVAVLAKLYGLVVGHAVMHGDRTDPAHSYGYDAADYLLAHFSEVFDNPADRITTTPVYYVGGMSRFKKSAVKPAAASVQSVAISLSPQAENNYAKDITATATGLPEITWHLIGQRIDVELPNLIQHGVIADPSDIYREVDVVVGSGGNNTIMELASLAKPFICIPEDRPYDEQRSAARILDDLQAAVYLPAWPAAGDWLNLLQQTTLLDQQVFSDLVDDNAAATAAAVIQAAGKL